MSDGADVVVTRWRRYGHDRLYVRAPDGTDLGWWDLDAGRPHARTPQREDAVTAAAAAWQSDQHEVRCARDIAPAAVEPVRSAQDLADARPGAAARARARAARDAAPAKTFFARLLGVRTEERAWRIGADGEEAVAARIARVVRKDPRWHVLHAIPVGVRGSDIDHLVVGPGGVYTVNAKHHPRANIWVAGNAFLVNGTKQPYIRNSRHEAARAAKLLTAACGFDVPVEPVIVTVNAQAVTLKSPPDGVHVVQRMHFARWLLRRKDVHPTVAVDAVYEAARRSTTWQP
ncbi:nuclease-related domain-containing protein [Prescottella equi]|uniref:nuclease-related domain-containing protein n=1 Tax=Rhodococcus hoagii TaxID=43767 RepID=UPI001E5B3064|nr:nuclease-related domain-containing protein [Prescottella equi]